MKEYFKRPTPDRRGCSTGKVNEDDKEVVEVDDDGPSVGNGAYNNSDVVENHFQKIKNFEVDTDLNAKGNIFVEEDTVNDRTQESFKGVNYDTSIGNGVDGSIVYDQYKEL